MAFKGAPKDLGIPTFRSSVPDLPSGSFESVRPIAS